MLRIIVPRDDEPSPHVSCRFHFLMQATLISFSVPLEDMHSHYRMLTPPSFTVDSTLWVMSSVKFLLNSGLQVQLRSSLHSSNSVLWSVQTPVDRFSYHTLPWDSRAPSELSLTSRLCLWLTSSLPAHWLFLSVLSLLSILSQNCFESFAGFVLWSSCALCPVTFSF